MRRKSLKVSTKLLHELLQKISLNKKVRHLIRKHLLAMINLMRISRYFVQTMSESILLIQDDCGAPFFFFFPGPFYLKSSRLAVFDINGPTRSSIDPIDT